MAEQHTTQELLFPDEDYFRAVMDELERKVAEELANAYVEDVEEYGMPPLRSLLEHMCFVDKYERDKRLMEILAITEHNDRAGRMMGFGEVITLEVPRESAQE